MKILIIDNNIDPGYWGAADLRASASQFPGVTIHTRRAPQGDLPKDPTSFDRVIVSGSKTSALEKAPWISALDEFIRRTVQLGKPFLGVCYGHQALARSLGGQKMVRKGAEPEFGWTRIQQTSESRLLESVPKSFYSFSAHFEEVAELPRGFKTLAKSESCEIQAVQFEDRSVYGIQFHPERGLEQGERTLADRKKRGEPKRLLHPGEGKKYYDPKVGEAIFRNFLSL